MYSENTHASGGCQRIVCVMPAGSNRNDCLAREFDTISALGSNLAEEWVLEIGTETCFLVREFLYDDCRGVCCVVGIAAYFCVRRSGAIFA